ncbi:hypothetical protein LWC35_37935 [Pseudonocardia kujensis]|uniref:hypothetical protein n=1 Tax=Pseudonocardia kujensis TaxID=1128675 RepID=UPI001E4BB5ED|nr:hypothetical protein [Pseudonocardia kujensis]MCE0768634.1 hypothetical protein [Pseudonocardia kujensis]
MRLRRTLPALAALAAGLLVLAGCSSATTPATGPDTDRSAAGLDLGEGWDWTPQGAPLGLGVTHTQDSLDDHDPAEANARGEAILKDAAVWQNVHLMGFGTLSPEPAPGQYDWSTLDQRMDLVKRTGARTVLTACCAPDWMKGGVAGQTDWDRLEVAPLPQDFPAYAALVAQTVQRYPQIERVVVWNELKGFFDMTKNRWDYEGYTALYNAVYTAVKAVRPDVQVGGPYPVMISLPTDDPNASDALKGSWGAIDQRILDALAYWDANKVGADFLAVDGGTAQRGGTIDGRLDDAAVKFSDVTRFLRSTTALPVWWTEFYAEVPEDQTGAADSQASAASALASVAAFARSGVSVALLWGPQGSSLPYSALWTDATEAAGGRPTPLTQAWEWLVPRLAQGTAELGSAQDAPLIAFRAPDGSAVVVNVSDTAVPVAGQQPLAPYAIGIRTAAT